jgi:hypothetical protein
VTILSVVAHDCPIDLPDGNIREIRQENLQAINVVGFRTGVAKESRSKSAERKIRLESVRKRPRERQFLLMLFVNSECQAFVSGLGRFHVPDTIDPDVRPIHIAAFIECHSESPPSSVNCLLFENPFRNLFPIEHELPAAADPEVGEPAREVALPHGPRGTTEEVSDLMDGEHLA